MTSLVHHLSFENMSILSHQQPPPPSSTASIKTPGTTLSKSDRPNSLLRPPLLSIVRFQPINSPPSSSKSSTSSTDNFPTTLKRPSPSASENRRKLRSARTDSVHVSPPPSNSSSVRSRRKHLSRNDDAHDQDASRSDSNDDDKEPVVRRQRLKLSSSIAPSPPPAIPEHITIPRSHYTNTYTPIVEPSYEIPRKTANDTHTCIRTKVNPHSVSISSQPPAHFSKPIQQKLNRLQKSNLSSPSEGPLPSLEMKRKEELDKWWYWSTNCKITGDGNKSSHLPPLRCKDLSPSQEHQFQIETRPITEPALEQQKFFYSG